MKAIDTNTGIEVVYDTTCQCVVHDNNCKESCPTVPLTPEQWQECVERGRIICFGCNAALKIVFGEPVNPFDQHYL